VIRIAYPALVDQRGTIERTIHDEVARFGRTLAHGLKALGKLRVLDGKAGIRRIKGVLHASCGSREQQQHGGFRRDNAPVSPVAGGQPDQRG